MRLSVTRREYGLLTAAMCLTVAGGRWARAQGATAIKLTLDGRIEGPSAPYLVALEAGYFKREGLEVSIEPSVGGPEPITRVATGTFDLAVADINALVRYRDQLPNAPVRAIFVVNNYPTYAIVGRKSRGIASPGDLDGKKLGLPTLEQASAQWPIFAKLNNIDPSKVTVVTVGVPVREPMLAAGEVDAVAAQSFGTPLALRDKGVPADDITTLMMSNYGLELYGSSIVANSKLAAEKPEAVQGFLRALLAGIKDTVRDPAAAIEAVLRRNNGASREVELERLMTVIRLSIVTPEVQANGLGGIVAKRFDVALEQIGLGYTFKNKPKAEDIFDARFLPPAADRQIG
jgi:NitT/TauT family transport system substrate-binding protein